MSDTSSLQNQPSAISKTFINSSFKTQIQEILLPDSVEVIQYDSTAFWDSVKNLSPLYNMTNLVNFEAPGLPWWFLTTASDNSEACLFSTLYLFNACSSLTSYKLFDSQLKFSSSDIALVNDYYDNNGKLMNVNMPNVIPPGMFKNCSSLQTISIPEYLFAADNTLDSEACPFSGCISLKNLFFNVRCEQSVYVLMSGTGTNCGTIWSFLDDFASDNKVNLIFNSKRLCNIALSCINGNISNIQNLYREWTDFSKNYKSKVNIIQNPDSTSNSDLSYFKIYFNNTEVNMQDDTNFLKPVKSGNIFYTYTEFGSTFSDLAPTGGMVISAKAFNDDGTELKDVTIDTEIALYSNKVQFFESQNNIDNYNLMTKDGNAFYYNNVGYYSFVQTVVNFIYTINSVKYYVSYYLDFRTQTATPTGEPHSIAIRATGKDIPDEYRLDYNYLKEFTNGGQYFFTCLVKDKNGDNTTVNQLVDWSLVNNPLPDVFKINSNTGLLTWDEIPTNQNYDLTIKATSRVLPEVSKQVTLHLEFTNPNKNLFIYIGAGVGAAIVIALIITISVLIAKKRKIG